ncbi:MAG: PD-(D/E)XK nuclease family protein [Armatimonadetes bacterium]|nr:PD-(D/E)XK nuclease family protein [Armatimonadota bacterium]
MIRKPTLSPSKITTYLACPTKYALTYVDPRGRWYLKSKSYYSFGTTLHAVLQRFHDAGDTGVTTSHEAVAALEESWIDAGYSSQEEMMEAQAEGKAIVADYIEAVQREPVTAKTLFVEKSMRLDMGEFDLIGRIDRVDEREDGTLEIIDYKSGRQAVSESDVADDLAMACYQLMLRAAYPGREVVATIIALRSRSKATASLEDADALTEDLQAIGKEILHRDYENLAPTPKPLCHDCDFLAFCRKNQDFAEAYRPREASDA